jgi:ABC-type uncharacterized transport system involved in gliding motility auxiliary subunit
MTFVEQRRIGLSTLGLLALALVAAVIASNSLLRGVRLDLTENQLYTIADGTRRVLGNIEEPINLYLFFSDSATRDVPFLRTYAARVTEMLEEFTAAADGQLILNVVDPVPFSEEEDRAAQFGLQPISLGTENIYFGLAATNSIGEEATVPFFQPEKENFLEYDLARLIYSLSQPDKVVVGLLSGISMTAGFDQRTQQITPAWVVAEQARQLFEIRNLPTSFARIEDDIDLLWLVAPKELDEQTRYAIDQFVMGGGRALIFVDPMVEIDPASSDPARAEANVPSGLQPLLDAWGIEFAPGQIVADNRYALSISAGPGRRPVRHLGILGLDTSALGQDDVVTSGLQTVNLSTAGFFAAMEDRGIELEPLLRSSTEAAALQAEQFMFLSDPETLLDQFQPTGEEYVLAARLQGALQSAFSERPEAPPPSTEQATTSADGAEAEAATMPEPEEHRASTANANLILVADVDMLSDRLWVQTQSFLGQQIRTAFASNGDFVVNALDNLSGSADLIGIRSRASFSKPFTTVESLRRDADARFRETEQRLQAELADTERKLAELQASRDDSGSLLMSPEQQEEVRRFMDQQVEIRQQLRAVQRDLDRSIEQLGTTLKVVNIVAIPLLLTITALTVASLRRRRKAKS